MKSCRSSLAQVVRAKRVVCSELLLVVVCRWYEDACTIVLATAEIGSRSELREQAIDVIEQQHMTFADDDGVDARACVLLRLEL